MRGKTNPKQYASFEEATIGVHLFKSKVRKRVA